MLLSDEEIELINPLYAFICSLNEVKPSTFDRLSPTEQVRTIGMEEGWNRGFKAAQLKDQKDIAAERQAIVEGVGKWLIMSLVSALGGENEISMMISREKLQRHMEFKLKELINKILNGEFAPKDTVNNAPVDSPGA